MANDNERCVGLGPYLYTAISRVLSDKMRVLAKLQRVGVPARRTVCAYVLASSTLLPISLLLLARSILQLAQHLQLTYAKNRLIATGTYRAFAFFVFLTLAHGRLQGSYKGLYSSRLANLVELGILNLLQLVFRIPLVYDTEATHDAVWRSTCLILTQPSRADTACFTRLFSFGDSLTDTGNFRFVFPNDTLAPGLSFPYGETFFQRPTGRFSNGRLIVDFIASALGLPFLTPYWSGKSVEDFAHGANFAVAGATAMGPEFFWDRGYSAADAETVHLDTQMSWFRELLHLLCPSDLSDCADMVSTSLFLVGEIGGNDYNCPLQSLMPFEMIRSFTPTVIDKISATITDLIELGAKTLLVPGNLPIGCSPVYLTTYKSNNTQYYEPETGCISWLNAFSQYHNKILVDELEKLRKLHPNVSIIYADYYAAAMEIFVSPKKFGIEDPLIACCGGAGPYGVSLTERCGQGEYNLCDDPQNYGSWDGIHPTEAAYEAIANGLLRGSYTNPPISTNANSCGRPTELFSSV